VNEDRENTQESDSEKKSERALLKARGRELEITGLGVIASLIIAFWSLVGDGTILMSEYLVFVSLLLVSAAGIAWRLWKLTPGGEMRTSFTRLKPGQVYRVTFGARGTRW
jgi:hypothetical protein